MDKEALVYLCLANDLLHQLSPDMITIAEDVNAKNVLQDRYGPLLGCVFHRFVGIVYCVEQLLLLSHLQA